MSDERRSILPPNKTALEAGIDLAFDKLLERIAPPFPELMDAQKTPAAFLPYLAADRGVSEWDSKATESEKRKTVASAWAIKRLAGTRRALNLVVRSLGLEPEVTPWHKDSPKADPYSIRIVARTDSPIDEITSSRLAKRLQDAIAERDTLSLSIVTEVRGDITMGLSLQDGHETVIYPYAPQAIQSTASVTCAFAVYEGDFTTIYPRAPDPVESRLVVACGIEILSDDVATVYPL